MTFEARVAFVLFFLFTWAVLAIIPWTVGTVGMRGRGGLLALPLAVLGGWLAGLAVPLAGMQDRSGLVLSMIACLAGATAGTVAGLAIARRIEATRPERAPTRAPPLTPRPKVGAQTAPDGLDRDPQANVD